MGERIAVMGAGIQGVCIALELAGLGFEIDLIDRSGRPISEASLWNEGKLHLGYIYANDPTGRTALKMIDGASAFTPFLQRHCGADVVTDAVSKPFTYCVLRDSLLSSEAVADHLGRVSSRVRSTFPDKHLYPGAAEPWRVERLSDTDLAARYNPDLVAAAFDTREISVDPSLVADRLRRAVETSPRINFVPDTQIVRVEEIGPDSFRVACRNDCTLPDRGEYGRVINALWADRLKIDATIGLLPPHAHVFRYKLAIHIRGARQADAIPSSTFMLGPFGDIVNFGGGRLYLSWYPACLVGQSEAVSPPDFERPLTPEQLDQVRGESLESLAHLVPGLSQLDLCDAEVTVRGGVIFSWGDGVIQNPKSRVHERWDIGVTSRGGYLSVDTGKYVMAPLHAIQAGRWLQGLAAGA